MSMSQAERAAVESRVKAPLKVGAILAEVTKTPEVKTAQAGHKQIVTALAPVEGDRVLRDLGQLHYLRLDYATLTPQQKAQLRTKAHGYFSALDLDFPRYPRFVAKGQYQMQDGSIGPYNKVVAAAVDAAVFQKLDEVREDPSVLEKYKGLRVYMVMGEAKLTPRQDTGELSTTQFINFITDELRQGRPIEGDYVDTELHERFVQEICGGGVDDSKVEAPF